MPYVLVSMEEAHIAELSRRFPKFGQARGPSPAFKGAYPDDAAYLDEDGSVSAYIRRCIGTVTELQAHQDAGGVVLVEYVDGSLREVWIDPSRDGVSLPGRPPSTRGPRRRRMNRRSS